VPHPDDAFCPYFHRPSAWPHTHHVHVVAPGGTEERRTLAFRDYLRGHPEVAREYERLKRGLAPHFDATLARIQEAQQQRDRQRLANPNLTLRQKSRIRAAQERVDALAPAR